MLSIHSLWDLVYENPLSVTILAVILVLIQYFLKSYLSRKRWPPGPYGLPIVGYSPFLGNDTHKSITKLGTKYGNVFTVQLGVNKYVIVNDVEALKATLSNDSILGRPFSGIFERLTRFQSILDESGKSWRDHREHYLRLVKDLGFGKGSMEDRVSDEISDFVQFIGKTAGKPVDIRKFLLPSLANNMSQFVLGYRFDLDDPKAKPLHSFLHFASEFQSQTNLITNSPAWVQWLLIKMFKAVNGNLIEEAIKVFDDEISKHQKSFNRNTIRDYIDGYLAEMERKSKKGPDTSFTMDKLLANSLVIFTTGTDTPSTACVWNFIMAAKYQDCQRRIQIEIDEVVGSDRIVTWADRHRLPYTQAFVYEVLRCKPTAWFNMCRRAEKDTHILNHFIPKDTLVFVNFWAVHHDLKTWTDPDQFNPNRFLTDDGQKLVNTERKRSCVGEPLARIQLFLYIAATLQRYTISAPNGHVISLEENMRASLNPKVKPIIVFNKRH